jgi:hypothetical protein
VSISDYRISADSTEGAGIKIPADYNGAPIYNRSSAPVTIFGVGNPVILPPDHEAVFERREGGGWSISIVACRDPRGELQ